MQLFDQNYWEHKFERPLDESEKDLLEKAKLEVIVNNMIRKLNSYVSGHDLYIANRTDMDGNCMFESLVCLGVHSDANQLRQETARDMMRLKHDKTIVPERTLEEAFKDTNDIENVTCLGKTYQYNFNLMCLDLLNCGSWERLNTQLVLSVIAKTKNIQINIYSSNEFKMVIGSEDAAKVCNLGLLDEMHYMPLKTKSPGSDPPVPKFTTHFKELKKWITAERERMKADAEPA